MITTGAKEYKNSWQSCLTPFTIPCMGEIEVKEHTEQTAVLDKAIFDTVKETIFNASKSKQFNQLQPHQTFPI